MAHEREKIQTDDLDGLRLLALGRIPRCGGCPRFGALLDAHARGTKTGGPLPGVPEYCTHQVCSPLTIRYECGDLAETPRQGEVIHLRAS